MAFAVDDYRALVQLLLDHPEWRAELRPLILGEETAALPSAVSGLSASIDRLDATVARLDARIDQLDGTVARLDARVDQLDGRIDNLDARLAQIDTTLSAVGRTLEKLNSRAGRLEGHDLETRYFHHVGAWFGRWLKRPRAVSPDDLDLDEAVEAGRITEDELEAVRSLDIIVQGTSKGVAPGEDALLAAEISLTIDTPDVNRAAERAAILRRAGFAARGFVGGEALTAHAAAAAKESGVIIDLRTGH